MPEYMRAMLCRVRKLTRSFFGSSPKRSAARSLASLAAFLVKARKAMFCGLIPFSRASSTMFRSVVVFPVTGGPNIRNIPVLLFTQDGINAAHDLPHPLPRKVEAFADGFEGHA